MNEKKNKVLRVFKSTKNIDALHCATHVHYNRNLFNISRM